MLKIAICDDNAVQLDIIQEELKKNIKMKFLILLTLLIMTNLLTTCCCPVPVLMISSLWILTWEIHLHQELILYIK